MWAVLDYTGTPMITRELLLVKLSILGPEYLEDQLVGGPTHEPRRSHPEHDASKLEREADAFPPPSATLDPGEVVPLEENGETLEMLFRFVDREEFVRLEDVEFDLLARVAEAAHKYRVYSAMVACRPQMK